MAPVRLLAFPYAGGGPFSYLHWTRLLSHEIELRVVSAPGRDLREHEGEEPRLAAWLDAITAELLADPGVPLALLGHSLGALMAYEVSRRLIEAGRPPVHLVVSAKAPAGVSEEDAALRQLADAPLLAAIRERFGGLPEELEEDPELLATVLRRLRNDLQLLEQFEARAGPPLALPLTVWWSPDDRSVDEAQMRQWGALVSGEVRYRAFPGGHFFLVEHAAAVCRSVADALDAGREGHPLRGSGTVRGEAPDPERAADGGGREP
jgi:surfactin synthase thioesterase subunit